MTDEERKQKNREYQRKYYAENYERILKQKRERESTKAYGKKHYIENKERLDEYQRQYRAKNIKQITAYRCKYRERMKAKKLRELMET